MKNAGEAADKLYLHRNGVDTMRVILLTEVFPDEIKDVVHTIAVKLKGQYPYIAVKLLLLSSFGC